ncbi:MAG: hypothetical protein AAFQ82_23950, partial [Myxococcota bacterium]
RKRAPEAIPAPLDCSQAGGYFEGWFRPESLTLPYGFWNRVLYSPLCLGLATLAFFLNAT